MALVVTYGMFHALPTTRYATLVIDPPWRIAMAGQLDGPRHQRAAKLPYETLTLEEIKAFPVADLCERGAHVYLWTTNGFLPRAFEVLESWGVRFHLAMPMVKRSGIVPCRGYVFGSEFCLLGFYGRPHLPFVGIGKLNWFEVNPTRGKHSVKPDEFYDRVSLMSPGPRLDCFARRRREGWDSWGDQVDGS